MKNISLGHCERSRVDRAISLTPTLLEIAEQNEQVKFAAQTFFWVQITLDEKSFVFYDVQAG